MDCKQSLEVQVYGPGDLIFLPHTIMKKILRKNIQVVPPDVVLR